MARFKLRAGEKLLSQHRVTLNVDGKTRLARLILTSDRLVVALVNRNLVHGLLDWLWRNNVPNWMLTVTHQIRRDRFASVEPGDDEILVFRDTGEGYGQVSFTITSDLLAGTSDSLQIWQQRMHAWASGTSEGAALPMATAIDR